MMAGEQTLRDLLVKANHPLLEVRTRSLRSLSLKLRSGLVAMESLVHEQAFLSHLLQWFNHTDWGSEQLPLGLLDTLAENEIAAVSLVDMGAVEFLSQLRPSCSPSLHPTIDSILEKLFRIPPSLLPTPSNTTTASLLPDVPLAVSSDSMLRPERDGCHDDTTEHDSVTHQKEEAEQNSNIFPTCVPEEHSTRPWQQTTGAVTSSHITATLMTSHYITPKIPGQSNEYSSGMQQRHGNRDENVLEKQRKGDSERTIGKRLFPWLRLSLNDVYILKATESHLLTTDSFPTSCQFLQDVLFEDFPAEVFLQRSSILQLLLSKLDSHSGMEPCHLMGVCLCLCRLNSQIIHRINHLDSVATDHFIFNDIHIAQLTDSGLTAATVNLTNQSCRRESCDLEQLTQDMLVCLQQSEMNISYYYTQLMQAVTKHIIDGLNRAGVREGDMEIESGTITATINACLNLLTSTVKMFEAVLKCGRMGRGEREENWVVNHLCAVLSQSLSLWRHVSNKCPPRYTHLQQTCHVTVCLAQCLERVLECTLQQDGSDYDDSEEEVMSRVVIPILQNLVLDGIVMVSVPELHGRLCAFLQRLDPTSYQKFETIKKLFVSFENMSSCLSCTTRELQTTPTSLTPRKELEFAIAALPGLWTVSNNIFVEREVKLAMSVLNNKSLNGDWTTAVSLLLKLLAHGSNSVQTTAYAVLKDLLISSPSFPPSLGEDFLDELCCHASFSSHCDVVQSATTILHSLLSMVTVEEESEREWMVNGLLKRLPFIEASLGDDERLFTVFHELIETECVPVVIRKQSLLRMMYSSCPRLRQYAYTSLTKLLSLTPSLPPSLHTPHDLMVIGKSEQLVVGENLSLERNDIVKLLHIVTSPSMDDLLTRSALQQLAQVLRDFSLHQPAIEEGIVSVVLNIFKMKLKPNNQSSSRVSNYDDEDINQHSDHTNEREGEEEVEVKGFWKVCVQCLQLLVLSNRELRNQLAMDAIFLMDLFRVSLECAIDLEFLSVCACLIASLVFSGVSVWKSSQHVMQLPENIISRLKFTFPVDTYTLQDTKHKTPCLLTPAQISHLPSPHTPSLLYHVTMAGGVGKLLSTHKPNEENAKCIPNNAPSIAIGDLMSLKYLWPPSVFNECLCGLREAESHSRVTYWLDHMTLAGKYCQFKIRSFKQEMTSSSLRNEADNTTGLIKCRNVIVEDWEDIIGRFIKVHPANIPDRALLSRLLLYLTTLINNNNNNNNNNNISNDSGDRCTNSSCSLARWLYGDKFLPWLVQQTVSVDSACLQTLRSLLERRDSHDLVEKKLERTLLRFYTVLSPHIPPEKTSLLLPLLQTLSLGLDQISVTQHDGLSSLHSCLVSLTHCTARLCDSVPVIRGKDIINACTHLAIAMREVICCVISSLGDSDASFMGHGLLYKASLSLSLLLRAVGASTNLLQSLFSDQHICGGYTWIQSLTNNRSPQVRCTGYSILASVIMCGEKELVKKLMSEWTPCEKFSVWGSCMSVGIDLKEWSVVRQQALLVLVALSSFCHRHSMWTEVLICRDGEVSLTGSHALEAFLSDYPPQQLLIPTNSIIAAASLRLLSNLTLSFPAIMQSHLEPLNQTLLKCCDYNTSADQPQLLHMYQCAVDTLRILITTGSKVILELLLSMDTITQLCQLLPLGNIDETRCGLCEAVFNLLQCVHERAPPEMRSVVPAAILTQWITFTDIICSSLTHHHPSPSSSLHITSLTLLHILLTHKLHPPTPDHTSSFNSTLTTLLDSPQQIDNESETIHTSSGGQLCTTLLDVYEGSEVKFVKSKGCGLEAGLVAKVMCLLLASSQTAKQTALKGGLLESSLEVIRGLHSQLLCNDSLKKTTSSTHRNKEPSEVALMCERFTIIRCLLFQSPEVKMVALQCGLVDVIGVMWSWCTVSSLLARAVLDTLTVFTASNSKGRTAMVASGNRGQSLLHQIIRHTSHCLSSHHSCINSRDPSSSLFNVLTSSFNLLTNCALSSECRKEIKKTGLLSKFPSISLRPPKSPHTTSSSGQKVRGGRGASSVMTEATLWVRLLVNITFHSDGQQSVAKLPGALDNLLDLYQRQDIMVQPQLCLLALHNLCFYGPAKTQLVENERFVSVLNDSMESGEIWKRAVAVSAVWALIHNCTKVKKRLRETGLQEKLEHLHTSLSLQLPSTVDHELLSPIRQLYLSNLKHAFNNLH